MKIFESSQKPIARLALFLFIALLVFSAMSRPSYAEGADDASQVRYVDVSHHYCGGRTSMVAVTEDGSLYFWGYSTYAPWSDGANEQSVNPIKVMDNVESVYDMFDYIVVSKKDGSLWLVTQSYVEYQGLFWAEFYWDWNNPILLKKNFGKVISAAEDRHYTQHSPWGYAIYIVNDHNELYGYNRLIGEYTKTFELERIEDNVAQVQSIYTARPSALFTVKTNGDVYAWGTNDLFLIDPNSPQDAVFTKPVKIGEGVKKLGLPDYYPVISSDLYKLNFLKTTGDLCRWTFDSDAKERRETKICESVKSICDNGVLATLDTNELVKINWDESVTHLANGIVSAESGCSQSSYGVGYAAIKADGTLFTWGMTKYGNLGDGKSWQQGSSFGENMTLNRREFSDAHKVKLGDSILLKTADISLSKNPFTYTGQEIRPAVTVTSYGKILKEELDYSLTYEDNVEPGEGSVLISGLGSYKGTYRGLFTIEPKTMGFKALKSAKKGFNALWTKQPGKITGYQIRYSKRPDMKNAKTKTIKKASTTSWSIKSLKSKTKYYVQIRSYRLIPEDEWTEDEYYYSDWSKATKVKTK